MAQADSLAVRDTHSAGGVGQGLMEGKAQIRARMASFGLRDC